MICCVKEYSIEEVMEEQYKMSVETRILFTDLDFAGGGVRHIGELGNAVV